MNTEFKCFMAYKQFLESLPDDVTKVIIYDWKDDENGGCGMMMNDHPNSMAYIVIAYTSVGTFYCSKIVSKENYQKMQKIESVIESLNGTRTNITKEMDKFVIDRNDRQSIQILILSSSYLFL